MSPSRGGKRKKERRDNRRREQAQGPPTDRVVRRDEGGKMDKDRAVPASGHYKKINKTERGRNRKREKAEMLCLAEALEHLLEGNR